MSTTTARVVSVSGALIWALSACGGGPSPDVTPGIATPTALPLAHMLAAANGANGPDIALGELIGGRVAVIDFWASWCRPCVKSLPMVDRLATEQAGGDLMVLAINVGETREQAVAFAEQLGLALPIFLDPSMDLSLALDISNLPTLIVVDEHGAIAHRSTTLDDTARARIRELLERR